MKGKRVRKMDGEKDWEKNGKKVWKKDEKKGGKPKDGKRGSSGRRHDEYIIVKSKIYFGRENNYNMNDKNNHSKEQKN